MFECPMCQFTSKEETVMQDHVQEHFSSHASEESPSTSSVNELTCPICNETYDSVTSLELHVAHGHSLFSPQKSNRRMSVEELTPVKDLLCPVCNITGFQNQKLLQKHVDEHFNDGVNKDRELAKDLQTREREAQRQREQQEFEMLQKQFGFVEGKDFKQQNNRAMVGAVQRGHMSLVEYHEKRIMQNVAERKGIDDSSSATFDVIPLLRSLCSQKSNAKRVYLSSPMDHYATSGGDVGWGCGYRNLQMMLSCLLRNPLYVSYLKRFCESAGEDEDGPVRVPSVARLQSAIEDAWRMGFDLQGCEQLGGKLTNSRKWIGATEIVALLSSCHIRCRLMDFHRPSSADGTHPAMMNWVRQYFSTQSDFKSPLYFQHQGHSRTIAGVEEIKETSCRLLVLDPSHSTDHMNQLLQNASSATALKRIRKTLAAMKHTQYQIVCIDGILDDREYEESKVLRSTRVP